INNKSAKYMSARVSILCPASQRPVANTAGIISPHHSAKGIPFLPARQKCGGVAAVKCSSPDRGPRDEQRGALEFVPQAGRAVKAASILLAGVALLGLVLVVCWPRGYMASRDIGCAKAAAGRSRDICHALSASMEWTWMGHAIIAPGWRPTWRAIAHVWCV